MEDHGRNFSITAFLVGGILGASASLLFAPKSGRELRANIKEEAEDYLKEAKSNADNIIRSSKSAGELLKRQAEDLMETVNQYTSGKAVKPLSIIEQEIAGLRAAITAVKASYSIKTHINKTNIEGNTGQSELTEFENEKLPKHIGMGKGRSRKSFYS
jgi:gas vesicle protein